MAASASTTTSIDLPGIGRRAGQATGAFVAGMRSDQWSGPTNCDAVYCSHRTLDIFIR